MYRKDTRSLSGMVFFFFFFADLMNSGYFFSQGLFSVKKKIEVFFFLAEQPAIYLHLNLTVSKKITVHSRPIL